MMVRSKSYALVAATFAALLSASSAIAAETVADTRPPADACAAAAAKLGGRMAHRSAVSESGKPVYIFVVRKGGMDYDAVCDAQSGLIQDITPHVTN